MGSGRHKRIRARWLPIIGAAVALSLGAVVAYADTINADGDVVKSGNNVSYTVAANFTELCSNRGTPVAGAATVKYNGAGIHFDPGATLTIAIAPDATGAAAGITTTGGTATVPNPWNTIGQTFTSPISTVVPVTVPNGTYVVTVDASAAAHDAHGTRSRSTPPTRTTSRSTVRASLP